MVKKIFIILLVSSSAWAMLKLNVLLQKTNNTKQERVTPSSFQRKLKRYTKIQEIKKQRRINRALARKSPQQKEGL